MDHYITVSLSSLGVGLGIGLGLGGLVIFILTKRQRRYKKENIRLQAQADTLEFQKTLLMRAQDSVMFVFSKDGVITLANEQAKTFLKRKLLTDSLVQDAVSIPEILEVIQEATDTNTLIKRELTLKQDSTSYELGEVRSLFIYVKPLEDEGEGKYTRVLISDITEQYRSDQIRKDFLANASHELKTPLAIINGYVETLIDDDMLSDQQTSLRFLGVMKKHGKRLAQIIDEMLMISKLESAAPQTLKQAPFKFKECIKDCLMHLDPLLKERNIQIEIALHDPEMILNADRFYWNQILFNLIENAIKQNPKKLLEIKVGSKECEQTGKVQIWVSDNGVGIPAYDLPFIFRRFYRVEKHHSQSKIKGTGLGLSIVKRAVEAHQGTISCDSVPTERTCFTIMLPLSMKLK